MRTVELTSTAAAELAALPEDQRAHLMPIRALMQSVGVERVRHPHVEHLEGPAVGDALEGVPAASRALFT